MGMQTLNTIDGRQLKIISAEIRVGRNERIEGGLFIETRVTAIFPGGRKAKTVSISPMSGKIWLKPLYGYNGTADVEPAAWAAFVRALPVVSCPLFPVEITPAIAERALAHELTICDCPAVTADPRGDVKLYQPETV